jgi:DNA-binding MurR/RpiR family transcriptional regulator
MNQANTLELGTMIAKIIEQVADAAAERAIARMKEEDEKTRSPEREPLLSKSDLARELRISTATVNRLVQEGLPYIQIGGGKRFRQQEAMAWLANRQQANRQPPADPDPPLFGDPLLKGVRLCSRRRRS